MLIIDLWHMTVVAGSFSISTLHCTELFSPLLFRVGFCFQTNYLPSVGKLFSLIYPLFLLSLWLELHYGQAQIFALKWRKIFTMSDVLKHKEYSVLIKKSLILFSFLLFKFPIVKYHYNATLKNVSTSKYQKFKKVRKTNNVFILF